MPWCLVASSIPSALDPSRGKIESNCFFTKCMAILSAQAIKQALQNKDDMELRSKKDFYLFLWIAGHSFHFVPKVGFELEAISHQCLLLAEKGYTKQYKINQSFISIGWNTVQCKRYIFSIVWITVHMVSIQLRT